MPQIKNDFIVITHRNNDNSKFHAVSFSDFKLCHNDIKIDHSNVILESEIIKMINDGSRFRTFNSVIGYFISVIEVDGHIDTDPVDDDRITALPLMENI